MVGKELLTEFQQDKFRYFFYHVLDLNTDHVISKEDFIKLNKRIKHYMDWSVNTIQFLALQVWWTELHWTWHPINRTLIGQLSSTNHHTKNIKINKCWMKFESLYEFKISLALPTKTNKTSLTNDKSHFLKSLSLSFIGCHVHSDRPWLQVVLKVIIKVYKLWQTSYLVPLKIWIIKFCTGSSWIVSWLLPLHLFR